MQWTKSQRKKLMYSLLGIFVVGMLVVVSVFMFSDSLPQWIEDKKQIIVSSILTYGSGALLLIKIITFIVGEMVKKRLSSNEKIEKFLTKEIEIKEQKDMKKEQKTMQNLDISNVYEIGNYKFILNDKKGIHITWNGDFNYQEFKYANNEFVERVRKIIQKDF